MVKFDTASMAVLFLVLSCASRAARSQEGEPRQQGEPLGGLFFTDEEKSKWKAFITAWNEVLASEGGDPTRSARIYQQTLLADLLRAQQRDFQMGLHQTDAAAAASTAALDETLLGKPCDSAAATAVQSINGLCGHVRLHDVEDSCSDLPEISEDFVSELMAMWKEEEKAMGADMDDTNSKEGENAGKVEEILEEMLADDDDTPSPLPPSFSELSISQDDLPASVTDASAQPLQLPTMPFEEEEEDHVDGGKFGGVVSESFINVDDKAKQGGGSSCTALAMYNPFQTCAPPSTEDEVEEGDFGDEEGDDERGLQLLSAVAGKKEEDEDDEGMCHLVFHPPGAFHGMALCLARRRRRRGGVCLFTRLFGEVVMPVLRENSAFDRVLMFASTFLVLPYIMYNLHNVPE